MLSRTLRRAVFDTRSTLPPAYLLPWTANLSTVSHTTEAGNAPNELVNSGSKISLDKSTQIPESRFSSQSETSSKTESKPPSLPQPSSTTPSSATTPITLSPSVRDLLPVLRAQSQHYITALIHNRPYLLTQGDTLRLPFLMQGVNPGDVLRLNCATTIGSRDYTLRAASQPAKERSPTAITVKVLDPTTGTGSSHSHVMPGPHPSASLGDADADAAPTQHFVYNQLKGTTSHLDERLFVCRAVVMGWESEPLRLKMKTKRRQRMTKTVKSKHRFTILKIKELTIRSVEEIEAGEVD